MSIVRLAYASATTLSYTCYVNCFVLKSLCSKTKQLRSILVKLPVLNKCLNGLGFIVPIDFGFVSFFMKVQKMM